MMPLWQRDPYPVSGGEPDLEVVLVGTPGLSELEGVLDEQFCGWFQSGLLIQEKELHKCHCHHTVSSLA